MCMILCRAVELIVVKWATSGFLKYSVLIADFCFPQQQQQQAVAATMQTQPAIAPAPMPTQSGTTTITTMSTLHQPMQHPMPPPTPQPLAQHPGVPHSAQMQQVSEWGHGRVSHPGVTPYYLNVLVAMGTWSGESSWVTLYYFNVLVPVESAVESPWCYTI